jgi:hypothetical protein
MRYHTHSSSTPSQTTLAYRARHALGTTAASVATVAAFTLLLSACFEPPKSKGASPSSGAAAPSSGGAAPASMPMDAASAPKQ